MKLDVSSNRKRVSGAIFVRIVVAFDVVKVKFKAEDEIEYDRYDYKRDKSRFHTSEGVISLNGKSS